MGNVDRSKQMQQDKIEPIRSSSRRGLSVEMIFDFFAGGSLISAEVVEGFIIPVDVTDVSVVSLDKLANSDETFCWESLYITEVAISAMEN